MNRISGIRSLPLLFLVGGAAYLSWAAAPDGAPNLARALPAHSARAVSASPPSGGYPPPPPSPTPGVRHPMSIPAADVADSLVAEWMSQGLVLGRPDVLWARDAHPGELPDSAGAPSDPLLPDVIAELHGTFKAGIVGEDGIAPYVSVVISRSNGDAYEVSMADRREDLNR
ncbi:MAG: hypothetical protein ABI780_04770 [Ardenticatenales bacterium]